MQAAGLELPALHPILKNVEPEIENLAGLLRLDFIPITGHALVADSVSKQLALT